MPEKDWEDEAIDIVNERFGDDPGYTPRSAKIILEDGSELDVSSAEISFSPDELNEIERDLEDLEWHRVALRPFNIELEWAEVDGEAFERMFAEWEAEQEYYNKIARIVFAIRNSCLLVCSAMIIGLAQLARRASERFGSGDRWDV